ncbi:MAG TPA: hypothetical protein VF618_16430 [Thermoanaerobaculia bacterium]
MLIDESIPEQITPYLPEFDVSTVRRERLKGLRNGVLLRAAVDRGFTVIFSADQASVFSRTFPGLALVLW